MLRIIMACLALFASSTMANANVNSDLSKANAAKLANASSLASPAGLNALLAVDSKKAVSVRRANRLLTGRWEVFNPDGSVFAVLDIKGAVRGVNGQDVLFDVLNSDQSVVISANVGAKFIGRILAFPIPSFGFIDNYFMRIRNGTGSGIELLAQNGDCPLNQANSTFDCSPILDVNTVLVEASMRRLPDTASSDDSSSSDSSSN